MNYFLILIILGMPSSAWAKRIVLEIPDEEIAIVEHDVYDAETWIKSAWEGKVSKCKERLIKQEIKTAVEKGESVPAGQDNIIKKAFSRPEYESRKKYEERMERERDLK